MHAIWAWKNISVTYNHICQFMCVFALARIVCGLGKMLIWELHGKKEAKYLFIYPKHNQTGCHSFFAATESRFNDRVFLLLLLPLSIHNRHIVHSAVMESGNFLWIQCDSVNLKNPTMKQDYVEHKKFLNMNGTGGKNWLKHICMKQHVDYYTFVSHLFPFLDVRVILVDASTSHINGMRWDWEFRCGE